VVGVSGIGSWPGQDVREALRAVRAELTEDGGDGVVPLPYLPELPDRGPGAELVGRGAGLLSGLAVDLQPQGWRLVDRPGRDAERTAALWRQDLDELAEAFDGWTGPFKLQVAGPWTLAASLWLPLGDRVLADAGAVRDLAASLAEGVQDHLAQVRRLLPGAHPVLQIDEPSLPAVLAGRIRSDSGLRALAAPEPDRAQQLLGAVIEAGTAAGATLVAVHCCGDRPPVGLLRDSGAGAVSLDTATLGPRGWESVATTVEAGVGFWAGVVPTGDALPDPAAVVGEVRRHWHELGLETALLADVTVTPACGLARLGPDQALGTTRAAGEVARVLAEQVGG
jgi:methionine synthase II (cobalamin-independent)